MYKSSADRVYGVWGFDPSTLKWEEIEEASKRRSNRLLNEFIEDYNREVRLFNQEVEEFERAVRANPQKYLKTLNEEMKWFAKKYQELGQQQLDIMRTFRLKAPPENMLLTRFPLIDLPRTPMPPPMPPKVQAIPPQPVKDSLVNFLAALLTASRTPQPNPELKPPAIKPIKKISAYIPPVVPYIAG